MSKLKMPPNCIDVTAQHPGTVITLVGAEHIRKQIAAGQASSLKRAGGQDARTGEENQKSDLSAELHRSEGAPTTGIVPHGMRPRMP